MNFLFCLIFYTLISTSVLASSLEDCRQLPSEIGSISVDWEIFRTADDKKAQELFANTKVRISKAIVAAETIAMSIQSSDEKPFICYEVAELSSTLSHIDYQVELILLLNRPGKYCFTYTKEEIDWFSLDIEKEGLTFSPITAMSNICGARGNGPVSYEGMKGRFDLMNGLVSEVTDRLKAIEKSLYNYKVRSN